MKDILAAILSLVVIFSGISGNDTPETSDKTSDSTSVTEEVIEIGGVKYSLTFKDDFDGNELDDSKWERCPEWHRQDKNNYWDNRMSYLDGEGHLIISMAYEDNKYISGAVRSKGRFEQAYGYYEIRTTLNNIPGYWTAFWLMNECVADETEGGRNGTEIDIYESPFCEERKIQHTLNWDGYGNAHRSEGKVVNADVYDGEYHTFGLLWTDKEYVFYIDGKETWRTNAEKALGTCEEPLYIKITAETGSWTKTPPMTTDLPDSISVDYVKVYQKV